MSRRLPLFLLLYADALSVSLIVSLLGPLLLHPQTELFLVAEPYPVRSAAYGILLGVYSLLMVYAAPFLGHLSDRVGRRPVLLLGAAGVALGGLGAGAAVSSGLLLLLLASRILAGATAAGQATAQAALVEGSPPSTRGSAISMSLLASALGLGSGPAVAGGLAGGPGLATPLYFSGLLGLAALLSLALLYRDRRPSPGRLDLGALRLGEGVACLVEAFRHPRLKVLLALFLALHLSWGACFSFASLSLLQASGFGPEQVGRLVSWLGAGLGLGSGLLWPLLARRLPLGALASAGLTGAALATGLSALAGGPLPWEAAAFLTGLALNLALPSMLTLLSELGPADRQGWVFGLAGSGAALGWGVSAVLAGGLPDLGPVGPLRAAAALLLAAGVALACFRVPAPPPSPPRG